MSLPLEGVRVVEYAQYVAGPLCGVLLADLGADVVKVEPPAGDGYRRVLPVAPELGRYFIPLNRGKRSVVVDLKTNDGLETSARLLSSADIVLHNFPQKRAARFGFEWEVLHAAHAALVVGRVSSFGTSGPLADPAYDSSQARAAARLMHPGDTVPGPLGGSDMNHCRFRSPGCSLPRSPGMGGRGRRASRLAPAALASCGLSAGGRLSSSAPGAADRRLGPPVLHRRVPAAYAAEASDDFVAVACLNVAQRRAFLGLFGRNDATVEAPDLVPDHPEVLEAKHELTAAIAGAFSQKPADEWLVALEAAGVPSGRVQQRETIHADPQVIFERLVGRVAQPGLGEIDLLAPFVRVGGAARAPAAAPALGADTDDVLGELA